MQTRAKPSPALICTGGGLSWTYMLIGGLAVPAWGEARLDMLDIFQREMERP